jgi:hypothetical protein
MLAGPHHYRKIVHMHDFSVVCKVALVRLPPAAPLRYWLTALVKS